ncbi:head-to-tail stopper [Mycobacterium phage Velveteen]|uniref:head-tail adaptor n=1 Tax=Mycobacterium phage Velveteen TaxID=1340821 RepID=UPI000387F1C1|nr:head-tail adaptor [Mycobacterium phage Velveteen]YP_009125862.1 head-tail adaptor [Mycobacterium phage Cerasum]ARM70604.1 head-to-tail stopper [Mycobacterium phage Kingsley]AVR76404.1 head-to-tail stopper [Mycobacterium phage BigPhil]QZD98492.1 head-to-tail stopper [Mycobacterium phage Sarma624]AGT12216.1 head-to-tail stopper [Mycobacterium phage Velveteen]AIK67411.1 head-to-tail stopper [Mycobacterium phage Cerasum]
MTFPTPYTVTHYPHVGDTSDGLGNTVPQFGAGVTVPVIQLAPHVQVVGTYSIVETETIDVDLYLPPGSPVKVKDRVGYGSDVFDVVAVRDWNMGFHGWAPGLVAELRKV